MVRPNDSAHDRPAPDGGMLVGALSRRTGISTAAINFYVRRGLLPRPRKTGQTRAVYDDSYVDRIGRIRGLQQRGLPLRVIARVIDSPDPGAELGLSPRDRTRAERQPIGIEPFIAQTGLSREELARAAELGLLRPGPRTPRGGEPMFDARDVAAGKTLTRLLDSGAGFSLLERHAEYDPLTRAEAHFLAEHVAAALKVDPSPRTINETAAAFARLRDYLRYRELLEEYPEWRNDHRS